MGQPSRCIANTLLLACTLGAGAASANPRFQLHGQLEAAPAAKANTRFALSARLQPVAPRPDPAAQRFVLSARLESDAAKAACLRDDRIFGNGFEDP